MSEPLISVIVPIYNVEAYLRECVDSILRQTYSNLEIILVDDGSPDKCPEICDEYAKKDNHVKVIHQNNGGLAHARNVGIANSNGDYLTFIDSDDFVADKYIEHLYKGLIENEAEVSIAAFYSFDKVTNLSLSSDYVDFRTITKSNCFKNYTSINTNTSMTFITAWNKLYKKELFSKIQYPEGKLYEDAFTTYKILNVAEKIAFSPTRLYYYRINPQSILGQSFKEKHLEMIEAFKGAQNYFKGMGNHEISTLFTPPLLMREIYCWWSVKNILKDDSLANKILDDYKKDSTILKNKKNVGFLWFLIFKTIAYFPWLYALYRKISPSFIGDR